MSNLEIQEKITNVENLLKNELCSILNLKDSTENDKQYLMHSLETLSNNFNTENIIEEPHMLPQLFKSLNDSLAKINSNLLIMKDLENSINSILFTLSLQRANETLNIDEIERQLNLYNLKKMETKTDILNNNTYAQKFIASTKPIIATLTDNIENSKENLIKEFREKQNAKTEEAKVDESASNCIVENDVSTKETKISEFNTSITNESDNSNISEVTEVLYKPYKIQENDTLLISEKQEKVYLPYTLSELAEYTKDTEKSLEDVIRENFVISLNTFKNPTVSRFKETYHLAKNKSQCSTFKSFNFAFEVMFKRSVNPAIIVACKNADELKDYLTCLKEQKLDLFKAFKIKYEINPMKVGKIENTLF